MAGAVLVAVMLGACAASEREPELGRPAEPKAISVDDVAGDATSGASTDLRQFELKATARGVCVRWTTEAPARAGTVLALVAHGPTVRQPGGAVVAHGHGFRVELRDDGARVTYGLDRLGSDAPRVLRGRVGQSGRTVSAFVPRSALDRPPANMPDRPPFPYRMFSFEARVISALPEHGGPEGDSWPQGRLGEAAYIDGRLCEQPCREPRLSFGFADPGDG